MPKFLPLATALLIIALVAVAVLRLPFLDKSGKLPLPPEWRQKLRRTTGYCMDGNQVYRKEERVPSSNPNVVCVCAPEIGGVACVSNRTNPNDAD